jgi:hypothetical protein
MVSSHHVDGHPTNGPFAQAIHSIVDTPSIDVCSLDHKP